LANPRSFRSPIGRAEIQKAISLLVKAADAPSSADACTLLEFGGQKTLSEHEYVREFLNIVNYHIADLIPLRSLREGSIGAAIRFSPQTIASLILVLDQIVDDQRAANKKHSTRYLQKIDDKIVYLPKVVDGRHLPRTTISDGDAAQSYVILLNPDLPYGGCLRRREFENCGHYFLSESRRSRFGATTSAHEHRENRKVPKSEPLSY
jgi:hypothetical protein